MLVRVVGVIATVRFINKISARLRRAWVGTCAVVSDLDGLHVYGKKYCFSYWVLFCSLGLGRGSPSHPSPPQRPKIFNGKTYRTQSQSLQSQPHNTCNTTYLFHCCLHTSTPHPRSSNAMQCRTHSTCRSQCNQFLPFSTDHIVHGYAKSYNSKTKLEEKKKKSLFVVPKKQR